MDQFWTFETTRIERAENGGPQAPLIRATAVTALLLYLQRYGIPAEALMQEAGFSTEELKETRQFISMNKFAAALELAAARTGDKLLGFHLGQHSLAAPHHAVVMACSTAPNVRSALDTLVRFKNLLFHCVSGVTRTSSGCRLEIAPKVPADLRIQLCDLLAAKWTRFFRQYLGARWHPHRVGLVRRYPPYAASEMHDWLGRNIAFGQNHMSMEVVENDLMKLMPSADPDLHKILTGYLDRLEERQEPDLEFAYEVRKFILSHLSDEHLTAGKSAQSLGISLSELNRRLRLTGMSYKSLHDAVRKTCAESYLHSTDLKLSEIAYLLGFSDQSAFTRACRRWFGIPPLKYRSGHKAESHTKPANGTSSEPSNHSSGQIGSSLKPRGNGSNP